MNEYFPLIGSFLGGGLCAFIGVKMGLVRLEVQMGTVLEELEVLRKRSHNHADDILIHDAEIGQVMDHLDLPRVNRQRTRG